MCLNIPHCKQWLLSELCETGESMSQRQPYFVYDGDSAKYALAAIAFTSGTTAGGPKGIPITVEHRMNTLRKYSQNYETSRVATEVSIVFTNMSYHTTRDELLFLMLGGGHGVVFTPHVVCPNEEGICKRESTFCALVKQLTQLRPTFISAVPAFWIELYNQYIVDVERALETLDPLASDFDQQKLICKTAVDCRYATMFGPRLVEVSTGSAHTPGAVYEFLQRIIGTPMLQLITLFFCIHRTNTALATR